MTDPPPIPIESSQLTNILSTFHSIILKHVHIYFTLEQDSPWMAEWTIWQDKKINKCKTIRSLSQQLLGNTDRKHLTMQHLIKVIRDKLP